MAGQLFSVSTERTPERAVLRARGELDETTNDLLLDAAKQELDQGRSVVVDMAGVTFMGSAGVASLVVLHGHASSIGATFRVAQPSRVVRRVIEMVSLAEVLLQDP